MVSTFAAQRLIQRTSFASSSSLTLPSLPSTQHWQCSCKKGRRSNSTAYIAKKNVLLSSVPTSATYEDIRHIASTPAIGSPPQLLPQNISKTNINDNDSLSKMFSQMLRIEFVRSAYLNATGKVFLSFEREEAAKEFAKRANGKSISGRTIDAQVVAGKSMHEEKKRVLQGQDNSLRALLILKTMQAYAPGRIVLLKGLPLPHSGNHLKKMLEFAYRLDKEGIMLKDGTRLDSVERLPELMSKQVTSNHLVRLASVSEAMRLVRNWHRQPLNLSDRRWTDESAQRTWQDDPRSIISEDRFGYEDEGEDRSSIERAENLGLYKTPYITDAYIMY